ncbi:MAG: ROK family protein [Chloroflexia bacterium]|nr:ROK family protein [Chloroflexia bacterium]
MTGSVLAVDLGGTNLRVAVVSADGVVSHRRSLPTEAAAGPEAVADRIATLLEETATAAGMLADVPAGVAVPGPVEPHQGVVYFMPNLPGWRNFALGAALRRRTRRLIQIANDGNCAALGESRFGVGAGVRDLIYLALGTGVGGGIISDGRLIEGVSGVAGEVGHVTVALDGPRCTCGSIGCLEAFVSGWAITREAKIIATTDDGAAIRRAAAGKPITPTVIALAASDGDPAALALLDRAGRALGAGVGSFINLFNPELVVIGGGVATLGEALMAPARRALASHTFPEQRACARLVESALGDDTALYGAAALAFGTANGPGTVQSDMSERRVNA